jgi:hypothetical protein
MKNRSLSIPTTIIVVILLAVGHKEVYSSRSRIPTWDLSFEGSASGGSLVLARTLNRTVSHISIQTLPGESGESVAQRLAESINWNLSRQTQVVRYDRRVLWLGGYRVSASGAAVRLPLPQYEYALAGTETGLGIPKPPLSLSCSYDQEREEVLLRWTNPPGGYDYIWLNLSWTQFGDTLTQRLSGTSTIFVIDRKKHRIDVDDMDARVIGFRSNLPSNAAGTHVSRGGHCQEELYGIPFTNAIAPNWTAWSSTANTDRRAFDQAERYPFVEGYNPALGLLSLPFYQVIKSLPNGVVHGVYRKFLGLTPGHTYRLTACLTTQDMDSSKGDWSLSLHAAPTPSGNDLSAEQLAGLAPLPDGGRGPEGRRIAFYGPGSTTKRDFALVFSGKDAPGGFDSSHITLPAGVDTITVWVRFSCPDPNGKVGFSGVKLEDLTEIKNPKSPAEVIAEENAAEIDLLKWIEKTSR